MRTSIPYWNATRETLARGELEALQLERLQQVVATLWKSVPPYRKKLESQGARPETIRRLEDIRRLPFTTKEDLRLHYPFGLFALPLGEVVRLHASSGTTGKPTVVGYSRKDMELWGELMARTLTAGGVTENDVVHNAYGYGLFTGGLGFGLGAETVGATTVPVSGGLTQRQLMLMEDFGATVLCCTPSYALVLAEAAEEKDRALVERLKLRVGFMGAEPYSEAMRNEIRARLGIEVFDVYGLSELIGPGVAAECGEHAGLHIFEDHFLPEIIDPETGDVLPPEADGELVLTSLSKEALPLVRYRTHDRVRLTREACACGRRLARMSRVEGRSDDMMILRGVNLFPSQIEEALLRIEGLSPQYLLLIDRDRRQLDELEVQVEAGEEVTGSVSDRRLQLEAEVMDALHEVLGIRVRARVLEPGRLERSQGKAVRVVDRRKD